MVPAIAFHCYLAKTTNLFFTWDQRCHLKLFLFLLELMNNFSARKYIFLMFQQEFTSIYFLGGKKLFQQGFDNLFRFHILFSYEPAHTRICSLSVCLTLCLSLSLSFSLSHARTLSLSRTHSCRTLLTFTLGFIFPFVQTLDPSDIFR